MNRIYTHIKPSFAPHFECGIARYYQEWALGCMCVGIGDIS